MVDITFDSMEKVQCTRNVNELRLLISANGNVHFNSNFLECLKSEYDDFMVDLRQSNEYRILAFKKGQMNDYKLPKSSSGRKDKVLLEVLKGYGYGFPVIYNFEKAEDGVWVGILEEVAPVPDHSKLKRRRTIKE